MNKEERQFYSTLAIGIRVCLLSLEDLNQIAPGTTSDFSDSVRALMIKMDEASKEEVK